MQGQVLKLLIILNVCFWATVSFGIWQYSAGFPQQVVSTVVVLGILSVLANAGYWVAWLLKNKAAGPANNRWVQAFILLSSIVQILLILFFLQ